MQSFMPFTPTLIGGSADLVESTKTEFVGGGVFSATHAGRNIAFGIREHAMGGIVNGIALHGGMVKPYGATFLQFSDYMRPAVRLSALGHVEDVWVWTHDSVALGEDGPTHQPVEHYAALRAIPNLWFVRPGDANETAAAWELAVLRWGGPVALSLTRQKLKTYAETADRAREGVRRGGYVVRESSGGSSGIDLMLLATGSELGLAMEANARLEAEGIRTRVVSLPCWEAFEAEDQAYRDTILPPDVRRRVAVEV